MEMKLTHVGLYVQDLDAMADFYKSVMGFTETDRGMLNGRNLVFLSRDPGEHHQLVLASGLKAPPVEEIINQISFRVPDLETVMAFNERVAALDVADRKPINHGNAWSVYFRDPENNRLEVYAPSPWYVTQPCRVPLQMDKTADEIRRDTERWCREQPGFAPAAVFEARIAALMTAV